MRDLLTATIDARALGGARILVAMASVPYALEWFIPLERVVSGEVMTVPIIATPPAWIALPLVVIAVTAGFTLLVGFAAQTSAAVVATVSTVVLLSDQQLYSNHMVLLTLMAALLSVSDCGRALTLRNYRTTAPVAYWPAFLIRVLVSSLYAWTAVAKLTPDYLSGEVFATFMRDDVMLPAAWLIVLAVASIGTELALAVALWFPRLRFVAIAAGVTLHLGMVVLLSDPAPLIPFAWLMFAGYLAFAWQPTRVEQVATRERPSSRRQARQAAPR